MYLQSTGLCLDFSNVIRTTLLCNRESGILRTLRYRYSNWPNHSKKTSNFSNRYFYSSAWRVKVGVPAHHRSQSTQLPWLHVLTKSFLSMCQILLKTQRSLFINIRLYTDPKAHVYLCGQWPAYFKNHVNNKVKLLYLVWVKLMGQ